MFKVNAFTLVGKTGPPPCPNCQKGNRDIARGAALEEYGKIKAREELKQRKKAEAENKRVIGRIGRFFGGQ